MDWPNRAPNPSNACAVAVNVVLSLTGSTFSATDTIVSNSVLISVVTGPTSITSWLVMCCGTGFFGVVNDTYLLPNTVVALISASTLAGISLMYFGLTSRANRATGLPSSWTCE